MSLTLYGLPPHDLSPSAIVITGSAEDAAYPATNINGSYNPFGILGLGSPSRPGKLTTLTGWWKQQHAAAIAPIALILVYPSFDADLEVYLEANTSDSFGAPPYQQLLPVPGPFANGAFNSVYMPITGAPSYAWWRLNVVGTNSRPLGLRRWALLYALPTMISEVVYGVDTREWQGAIVQRTALGVRAAAFALGGMERVMDGTALASAAGHAELTLISRTVQGQVIPFYVIPDSRVNDPWYVQYEEDTRSFIHSENHYPQAFRIREVDRGVWWP